MRSILFFDLPSVTKKDHKEYSKFLKFLKSKGFCQMQESVYTKMSLNENVAKSAINEVRKNLPKDGIVSVLTLSEKQFASIEQLLGEISTDVITSNERLIKL